MISRSTLHLRNKGTEEISQIALKLWMNRVNLFSCHPYLTFVANLTEWRGMTVCNLGGLLTGIPVHARHSPAGSVHLILVPFEKATF